MSEHKTQQYVSDELNKIWEQTREWESYALGVASGYYQFYRYYKSEFGEEIANKCFKTILTGTNKVSEHFRKIVELDIEQDSEVDEIMNKLKACLDKKSK